jgi:hypothetical protein
MSVNPASTPSRISEIKATVKAFKTLGRFFDYYDNIAVSDESIPNASRTYSNLMDWLKNDYLPESLRTRDTNWYGTPLPSSVDEGLARTKYQRMDEFNDVYKRVIEPRIQDILNISRANLEMPTLKYNDLGIGIFDFAKAASGLVPTYHFYSFKFKDYVDGEEVETIKEKNTFKSRLKSDKSPVLIAPKIKDADAETIYTAFKEVYDGAKLFEVLKKYKLKIGGAKAFGSTIKKVYVNKEKVPKLKNSIRIFVNLGANCNITSDQLKWTGYTAIGIAQIMSTLGYAVSVIGIYGCNTNINYGGKLEYGTRFVGINLKNFDETLDAASLLYVCSDATFFRMKIFEIIVKNSYLYKDYIDTSLGSTAEITTTRSMVFNSYGKRDGLFNPKGELNIKSEFLYYILGDIYSEQAMNEAILEIKNDVVNQNKIAKEKLMGLP